MRVSQVVVPFAVAVSLAACDVVPQPGMGPDARREIDRAERAAAGWIVRARGRVPIDGQVAVAVGYLERLRLGLGSPFRLIDYALADPRLPDSTRTRVAWALLARTLSGDAYEIDPVALDRIGLRRQAPVPGSGRLHLDLIDGAIRESSDPRGAELAVRLGYMLATAAGDLGRSAPDIAGRAAALIRDRELAREDAARLLRVAADSGVDALRLVTRWRAERRFAVERPAMEPIPVDAELEAMEVAPRLARVLGLLAAGAGGSRALLIASMRRPTPLLGYRNADVLAAAADSLSAPPATPVAVATLQHRDELVEAPWISGDERAVRERFVEDAFNEETFAAGYATLRSRSPWDSGPASVALSAAVALRAWAQEPVWLPGTGGPSARELQERWGLAAIGFGDDVPAGWRPYYRRMIHIALTDLSRVLPALDLRGLSVLITNDGRRDATLALHDPRRRRLVLPPRTAAGTLAHEIAHDLDWQVALERYRVRGDYGSDRAMRMAGDRLGERLQDMASAFMESKPPSGRTAHSTRPAEVFARNVDFFVAVSLAAQGRTDGYLSSVQDDLLTGYGSVRPPDISGTAGHALVSILDEVAPLYPSTREWFVKHYGLARSLTPYDLVRRMLDTASEPPPGGVFTTDVMAGLRPGEGRFREIEAARDAGFAAIDAWVCRAPGAAYYRKYETARRQLVLYATRARSRAVTLELARRLGGRRAEDWMAQSLDGEPGPFADEPDPALRAVLVPLLERAIEAGTAALPEPGTRIEIMTPAAHCAAGPLPFTALF